MGLNGFKKKNKAVLISQQGAWIESRKDEFFYFP